LSANFTVIIFTVRAIVILYIFFLVGVVYTLGKNLCECYDNKTLSSANMYIYFI